jgi:hypothetical protein
LTAKAELLHSEEFADQSSRTRLTWIFTDFYIDQDAVEQKMNIIAN